VIATKGGLTPLAPAMGAKLPTDHLKQASMESQRLRLDRIDLYQLHTVDSKVQLKNRWCAKANAGRGKNSAHWIIEC